MNFGQLLVMPAWLSHALALLPGLVDARRRAAHAWSGGGRPTCSPGSMGGLIAARSAAITVGLQVVVCYLNLGRGVPWMFGLFVAPRRRR